MPKSPLPGQRSVGIAAKDLRVEERMRNRLRKLLLEILLLLFYHKPPSDTGRVSRHGHPGIIVVIVMLLFIHASFMWLLLCAKLVLLVVCGC